MKAIALIMIGLGVAISAFAAAPTITSFSPLSAAPGMTVTINGTDYANVTAVTIGGTAASSFTVVSTTKITAIVPVTASGVVQVTTLEGSASRAGFIYIATSGIITTFDGLWSSTAASPNATIPDNSHSLLAFTYNGTTYATGVNNAVLTSNNIPFTSSSFSALPVAGITGVTASTSTYLALGKKVDGSATVANTPAVASYSIKTALSDGVKGLDLGTGVTNLPATAVLTFQISNIDPSKVADNEPDLILTQIAQPVSGNDIYSFIDASGNVVGSSFTQDMTLLPKFGSYDLDLFNLTPNTPYNTATAYSAYAANTNREIRLMGLRLSDFGLTTANVSQVKALRVTPSGNSDYAFVAYNTNAINLPPNVTQNATGTNTTICSGGSATMAVVAAAATNGALSYTWEESSNGGAAWTLLSNGGNYSGASTNTLSVANAQNNYKYRATVREAGNANTATSTAFTITVSAPAAPTNVTVSSTTSTCLNNAVQLTSAVTGGSNLTYQWRGNSSGTYQDIPGATLNNYVPPVNQTGAISYNIRVASGSGCPGSVMAATPATVTVTGVSTTTPAAVCSSGSMTLGATPTSGSIDWYNADAGGTILLTANTFTTPVLNTSKTYYVAASGCASALRVPVTATVHPATVGGSVSGGGVVTTGTNSTTLTLNGHTGNVVKWQASTDNFAFIVNDIANTTTTLTATNLTQTQQYRAFLQSGTCSAAPSASATITVAGVLAIHGSSIKAVQQGTGVLVQWSAYDQEAIERFEVERSSDGITFSKVHAVVPGSSSMYRWLDQNPTTGLNIYRIKEWDKTGRATYSATVRIVFTKTATELILFPNPAGNNIIHLQQNSLPAGTYQVQLRNSLGQIVNQTTIVHSGGMLLQTLHLPSSAGLYLIELWSKNKIVGHCRVRKI